MREARHSTTGRWLAAVATSLALTGAALLAAPSAGAAPLAQDDKNGPLTPRLQELQANRSATPSPGPGLTTEIPEAGPGSILTRPSGRILVDVRMTNTNPKSLDQLRETGARIVFVADDISTVTVAIFPSDLAALAALSPLVESAQEVLEPATNAACPTGPFVSEGLSQLRADIARTQFAVEGRDITVGVLSDSYDRLNGATTDVTNGELPGTSNPCGNLSPVGVQVEGPSGADEGRAMAQIIHDIAPDAKIIFASAFLGEAAFAQSIRDLAADGADIIVDDITYFAEPMYQDGVIAKAVADVTDQGVVYFSSAGNSNKIIGGKNVASYEAQDFRPTACPTPVATAYPPGTSCHDFDPSGTDDPTYGLSINGNALYLLGWSEPQFGITTDVDLCVVSGGSLVTCDTTDNLTTQDAFAGVQFGGTGSGDLVVVRAQGSGTPRLKLISWRSALTAIEYDTGNAGDVVGPTIFGHNASRPGATVAAVPYDNASILEPFSSFGPATYCWGPVVGTSPASAIPCETATVDMSATDGTQNSFFGGGSPPRFYGTSAAAPHAAAVAALMLDREQCMTPAQVLDTLKSTGRAVGAAPQDGAGGGLVDSEAALAAAGAYNCDTTPPLVTLDAPAPPASGWFTTPSVEADVTATDRRTVTELMCTSATVSGLTGIGTTSASAKAIVSGDGVFAVDCTGKDFEDNAGAANGSTNTATIKIDTSPPVLTCQAASFDVGQSGEVTASVSDAGSGPAATSVSTAATTDTTGSFTATLSATDIAGNSTTTACAYTVTEATEPGTMPPAGLKRQKPANSAAKPPKRIKTSGLTVIAGKNPRTNAGQRVRTRVDGRPIRPTASGEVRYFKVVRGPKGKVSVRTYGYPGLRIVVRQTAPSTTGYKRYKRTSVYLDGRRRGA